METILDRLVLDAETRASPARSIDDFVPVQLIGALVDVVEIFHESLTTNIPESNNTHLPSKKRSPENSLEEYEYIVQSVVGFLDRILGAILQVQLTGEAPFQYTDDDGYTAYTRRHMHNRITGFLQFGNTSIFVPESALNDQEEYYELFQFITILPLNPYVWGQESEHEITSSCIRIEFQYTNSTVKNITDLNENSEIEIEMQITKSDDIYSWSTFESQEVKMTQLDINSNLYDGLINVVVCSDDESLDSLKLTAYLARGYEPYSHRYDEKRHIGISCQEGDTMDQIFTIEDK